MTSLDGSVALITGGGSGIGAETARALSARGVRCVVSGRRAERLDAVSAELRAPSAAIAADLVAEATPAHLVAETIARFGRLDVVVHAAGMFEKRSIVDTDDESLDRVLDLNLRAVVALTRHAWPHLCEASGQIVLVSSVAALEGFSGNTAYAASKGAMVALGEVLREEGRDDDVRVITVCPAQIDTELWAEKAPARVREHMMTAAGVGGLLASLVEADRTIDFDPVVIRPPSDPWTHA